MTQPKYEEHRDKNIRIQSAKTAIDALIGLELYPAHKRELLSVCIWKITEADGKKKVRYWSEGALSSDAAALQHEHVNERKVLINRLLDGECIDTVINDAVACMVTKQEHTLLTQSNKLGWERYRNAQIKVYDSLLKKWTY